MTVAADSRTMPGARAVRYWWRRRRVNRGRRQRTEASCDVSEFRAAAAAAMDPVTVGASIDGVPLRDLRDYRVQSPIFGVILPKGPSSASPAIAPPRSELPLRAASAEVAASACKPGITGRRWRGGRPRPGHRRDVERVLSALVREERIGDESPDLAIG